MPAQTKTPGDASAPNTFYCRKHEDLLKENLLKELHGIQAWAVRSSVEHYKNRLIVPKAVRMTTDQARGISDPVFDFIATTCVRGDGPFIPTSELFAAYCQYCITKKVGAMHCDKFVVHPTLRKYTAKKKRVVKGEPPVNCRMGIELKK